MEKGRSATSRTQTTGYP